MDNKINILVINPGSTSTKIGWFENETLVFEETLRHSAEELKPFDTVADQFDFRKEVIIGALKKNGYELNQLQLIMARGGLVRPLASGVYAINEKMCDDLRTTTRQHASNLAALIADAMSKELNDLPCYIADPVMVDELQDVARLAGHPKFERHSVFHALNQKAVARKHAQIQGKKYEDLNLIVAHMGGGISVGAHQKGKVIDVTQALDGDGPFSPERSGTLPSGDLIRMAFSGDYSEKEMMSMIVGQGGILAYLGTSDGRDVKRMAVDEGNKKAQLVSDAMTYQIAKCIGEMATVLRGDIDGILLTGGVAYNDYFMSLLIPRIEFLGAVHRYPGEDELEALASNGLLVLRGELDAKEY